MKFGNSNTIPQKKLEWKPYNYNQLALLCHWWKLDTITTQHSYLKRCIQINYLLFLIGSILIRVRYHWSNTSVWIEGSARFLYTNQLDHRLPTPEKKIKLVLCLWELAVYLLAGNGTPWWRPRGMVLGANPHRACV